MESNEQTAEIAPETPRRMTGQLDRPPFQVEELIDLIARVRHEINNPLTGVIGQAQLLLREDLSDKARQRVEAIEGLATRIRDIVAMLRDVQRPLE
ncbi:MAG: histidine kinase dimerization/phospho-acceptor domain-containing protein [Pyrinomonadaceae bacterium]